MSTKSLTPALTEKVYETLQELSKIELELKVREEFVNQREKSVKNQSELLQKRTIDYLKKVSEQRRENDAKLATFSILKNLPPPMSRKGKNEHFPIVRFCYQKHHSWYVCFIRHYEDTCRILRNIHGSEGVTEALQIQIVAVFHYKNFPAYNFDDLHSRVVKLVTILEDIYKQDPVTQLQDNINFFKYLTYPDEAPAQEHIEEEEEEEESNDEQVQEQEEEAEEEEHETKAFLAQQSKEYHEFIANAKEAGT